MMQEQPKQKNVDEQSPVSAVRRSIVAIGGSALAAYLVSPKLAFGATYPDLEDEAPQVDGFFFVIPGKNKMGSEDVNGDRVFFISSSWLPYFELTDQLTEASLTAPVQIASPNGFAEVTWQRHGLSAEAPVKFSSDGPTGITAGATYYVRSQINDDTFQLSATPNGGKLSTTGSAANEATVEPLTGKQRVLGKFKRRAQKDWSVLYSDDLRGFLLPNTTTQVIPLEDPREGTYLAMHVSPSL
jgi:hypothetical protein